MNDKEYINGSSIDLSDNNKGEFFNVKPQIGEPFTATFEGKTTDGFYIFNNDGNLYYYNVATIELKKL